MHRNASVKSDKCREVAYPFDTFTLVDQMAKIRYELAFQMNAQTTIQYQKLHQRSTIS